MAKLRGRRLMLWRRVEHDHDWLYFWMLDKMVCDRCGRSEVIPP